MGRSLRQPLPMEKIVGPFPLWIAIVAVRQCAGSMTMDKNRMARRVRGRTARQCPKRSRIETALNANYRRECGLKFSTPGRAAFPAH